MDKLLILFTAVIAIALASPLERLKRQILMDIDPQQLIRMLNNAALVEAQRRCLLATDQQATSFCDRIGKKLRVSLADTIRQADCNECPEKEKKNLVAVITTVQKKYPNVWQDIINHYGIKPEEVERLNEWVDQVEGKIKTTQPPVADNGGEVLEDKTVTQSALNKPETDPDTTTQVD
ncbi:hypothetical protein CHUAL_008026 [Chamberlinius hualienensis]